MSKHEAIEKAYIEITSAAGDYLASLLEAKEEEHIGVRVFVTQPGTPNAETCLAYCPVGDEEQDDLIVAEMPFSFFIERNSVPYLKEAFIDFQKDDFGGQLTIKAPHSKMMKVDENSPISDQVNHVLYTEINPALASHGGAVSLVGLEEEESVAVLQFGGGCQGCGDDRCHSQARGRKNFIAKGAEAAWHKGRY